MVFIPIKGIITDFSGVMVEDGLQKLLRAYAEAYGMPPEHIQAVNRKYLFPFQLAEMTEKEYWQGLLGELGMEAEIPNAPERLREAHAPVAPMFDLLRGYKGKKRTGLLTNNTREWMEYFERRFRLKGIFDVIVSSYECGYRKPDPRIYHIALDKLGTPDYSTVVIDDQRQNLGLDELSGIPTILHISPEDTRHSLERLEGQ